MYLLVSYIDFTKAFDRVNYWKLFNQLLDDGIRVCYVKLLAFWYTEQVVYISWQNNGSRQGGVLSPYLFTRYVRNLLKTVNSSGIGCSIGGIFVHIFAYADDMVLLAPCWTALQELIILIESICREFDLVFNTKKTVCMMFCPKDNS